LTAVRTQAWYMGAAWLSGTVSPRQSSARARHAGAMSAPRTARATAALATSRAASSTVRTTSPPPWTASSTRVSSRTNLGTLSAATKRAASCAQHGRGGSCRGLERLAAGAPSSESSSQLLCEKFSASGSSLPAMTPRTCRAGCETNFLKTLCVDGCLCDQSLACIASWISSIAAKDPKRWVFLRERVGRRSPSMTPASVGIFAGLEQGTGCSTR
jgi:hypothetical protein